MQQTLNLYEVLCMHVLRFALPAFLVLLAVTGCSGADGEDDDPIAPNCAQSSCAEVQVSSSMACHDAIDEEHFGLTTTISGRTEAVNCYGVPNAGGGQDLQVYIRPHGPPEGDSNEVGFRLRQYTGPGTYPLINLDDEGDHHGLLIQGHTSGTSELEQTVGTVDCIPQICEAVVSENSEPIPTDPYQVHDFRLRVEIRCPAGGKLTDMHCESDAVTSCTFNSAPTLKFDLVCAQ